MEKNIAIRGYQPHDRPAVQELSCDTADQGRPVERFFHDRQAAADVLVRYYTDWEPQSLWVAECDGELAGYLSGCLDSRSYNRTMMRKVIPRAAAEAVGRGALGRLETWRLLASAVVTLLRRGLPKINLDKYPAHFHINVREGCRGRKIGRQLVERFIWQVEETGGRGIHVVVLGYNEAGRRFFESVGFRLLSEQPLILPEGKRFQRTSTVVYGWTRED